MIEKHLAVSQKVDYLDLDWEAARRAGLTEAEVGALRYFSDIEGQTVFYLAELLKLEPSREPDTLAFATIWNYEEFFHAWALSRLLCECGAALEDDRVTRVRVGARLRAKVEDAAQVLLARLFPRAFVALWMTWGASQELLTLRGYETLAATTANPTLKTLCERIAKQERRHFAWYYNSAREHLGRSRFARRFVRFIFERFWTPVGVGVKSEAEVRALVRDLFRGPRLGEVLGGVQEKLAALPGLEGTTVIRRWASQAQLAA